MSYIDVSDKCLKIRLILEAIIITIRFVDTSHKLIINWGQASKKMTFSASRQCLTPIWNQMCGGGEQADQGCDPLRCFRNQRGWRILPMTPVGGVPIERSMP
jgi:hypothetical protein